jgi:hypothetical protein
VHGPQLTATRASPTQVGRSCHAGCAVLRAAGAESSAGEDETGLMCVCLFVCVSVCGRLVDYWQLRLVDYCGSYGW